MPRPGAVGRAARRHSLDGVCKKLNFSLWAGVDNPARFCWGDGVKFLPTLRPLALLGLAISFAACSTPENRRELYNSTEGNGPWHDYARRMDAAEETGVAPGDMGHPVGLPGGPATAGDGNNTTGTTVVRGSRVTRQPKSAPIISDPTVLPSGQAAPTAPAVVPAPAGVPSSPTTTDTAAPAAPGGATTVPPSDPTSVPVNPPTT